MTNDKESQEQLNLKEEIPSLWILLWLAMAASLCSLVVMIWFHYQSVLVENREFERSAKMLSAGLASAIHNPLILRDYGEIETKLKQALSVELLTSAVITDDLGHVLSSVERSSNGKIVTLYESEKILTSGNEEYFDRSNNIGVLWRPIGSDRKVGYMQLKFRRTYGDESLRLLREKIITISIVGAVFLIVLLAYLINRLKNIFKSRVGSLIEAQEELMGIAYYDSLTGLPNRRLFHEFINKEIQISLRRGNSFAVVFCDLNDFKQINDKLGHDAGDQLLICVAKTLSEALREVDVVSRFGGDEFVMLLRDISTQTECNKIINRIIKNHSSYIFNGVNIDWTLSMGIALFPTDGTTEHQLIYNADKAMYAAKQMTNGSCFVYYEQ